jgi:hypothetical protein
VAIIHDKARLHSRRFCRCECPQQNFSAGPQTLCHPGKVRREPEDQWIVHSTIEELFRGFRIRLMSG